MKKEAPKTISIEEFGIVILLDNGGGRIIDGLRPTARWRKDYVDGMIDGFERFLLALACEGYNIASPEFKRAIETVVDAIDNES